MILALLAGLALAAPPPQAPSAAVVRGEDLAAWEALEQADDPPTADALEDFVLTYPRSPLAELAWSARLARGPVEPAFLRAHREHILPLERSLATHAEAISRPPAVVVVAPLAVEDVDPRR